MACFDTAFHRQHRFASETFALPLRYYERGVRRYGFHGISYESVMGDLARMAPELASGRVVVAHLGNGASMTVMAIPTHEGRVIARAARRVASSALPRSEPVAASRSCQ